MVVSELRDAVIRDFKKYTGWHICEDQKVSLMLFEDVRECWVNATIKYMQAIYGEPRTMMIITALKYRNEW